MLEQRLRDEARQSVARELVLEAVVDKLGIEVSDDDIREQLREQGERTRTSRSSSTPAAPTASATTSA